MSAEMEGTKNTRIKGKLPGILTCADYIEIIWGRKVNISKEQEVSKLASYLSGSSEYRLGYFINTGSSEG